MHMTTPCTQYNSIVNKLYIHSLVNHWQWSLQLHVNQVEVKCKYPYSKQAQFIVHVFLDLCQEFMLKNILQMIHEEK